MSFCFMVLLAFVAVARTAVINNELQPNSTLRVEGQNPNSTNGTNSDKGFWEWLANVVNPPIPISEPPQVEKCEKCTCGLTNKLNRIVGGVETLVNQYPWMILLLYKGQFYCGGTLINSRYVLTAAHCVDRFNMNEMTVRIFEHDRKSTNENKTQDFQIEYILKHIGYSTINYNNDIALIKLKTPVRFQGSMRPVCLPEPIKTFAGEKGIVTGWGAVNEGGMVSQTLREVTVPILSNAECRATKYPPNKITDNMLCAGYTEGGKDSCQGDSGGPLHVEQNGIHQIVDKLSFKLHCLFHLARHV